MRIPKSDHGELLAYFVIAILIILSMCMEAKSGLVKVIADLQVCPGGTLFCQNQTSYGSGVCVGYYKDKSIVLTAGHLFQGNDKDGLVCPAKLHRLRVQGTNARVLGSWVDNKANDFAILLVDRQFKEVVPIGLPPVAGDTITIYGYDYAVTKDPQLSTRTGKIVKSQRGEMSDVNFTSAIGVSGGPAIDTSGNLAGILVWASGIQPNIGFRESIKQLLRDANLPPPHPKPSKRDLVPDPPDDTLIDKTADQKLQAEIDRLKKKEQGRLAEIARLKKEKADWLAAQKKVVVPDPPPEDVGVVNDLPDKGNVIDKAKGAAGKVLDAAEVGVSFADNLMSNPLVMAALGATGVGGGLVAAKAGMSIGSALLAWRRRRKDSKGGLVGKSPPDVPQDRAEPQPVEKDGRIDKIIEYLKDKEKPVDLEAIAKSVSGLLVTQELQADGKTTEEQLWRDGVRLAKEGALRLNVLGGKEVAKSIEDFVYSEQAKLDGKALRGTN